jgi:hypothetical protein
LSSSFAGVGFEEIREFLLKIIFSFPSGFLLEVITPLDFVELQLPPSGETNLFLKDTKRGFPIGQVLVQV